MDLNWIVWLRNNVCHYVFSCFVPLSILFWDSLLEHGFIHLRGGGVLSPVVVVPERRVCFTLCSDKSSLRALQRDLCVVLCSGDNSTVPFLPRHWQRPARLLDFRCLGSHRATHQLTSLFNFFLSFFPFFSLSLVSAIEPSCHPVSNCGFFLLFVSRSFQVLLSPSTPNCTPVFNRSQESLTPRGAGVPEFGNLRSLTIRYVILYGPKWYLARHQEKLLWEKKKKQTESFEYGERAEEKNGFLKQTVILIDTPSHTITNGLDINRPQLLLNSSLLSFFPPLKIQLPFRLSNTFPSSQILRPGSFTTLAQFFLFFLSLFPHLQFLLSLVISISFSRIFLDYFCPEWMIVCELRLALFLPQGNPRSRPKLEHTFVYWTVADFLSFLDSFTSNQNDCPIRNGL